LSVLCTLSDEVGSTAGQFAQPLLRTVWNEAAPTVWEQIGDPLRVFEVGLPARRGFDVRHLPAPL
jgi:hypothetical protein